MIEIINEAKRQVLRTVSTKKDAFLVLCSLNLLNAAIKKAEYKRKLSYAFIKTSVMKFILQCIDGDEIKYVDEVSYDIGERCVYVRCFGIQFAFHSVDANSLVNLIDSPSNKEVAWDGVRLQPIAFELFDLASQVAEDNTLDGDYIQNKFKEIITTTENK